MLPELGKYAVPVLAAYGSMFVLLGGLIVVSILRGSASKATLKALEKTHKKGRNDG